MEEKIQENPLTEEKKGNFPCCSCSGWKIVVCVVLGLLIIAGAVYAGYFLGRKSLSPRELLTPPKPITTQIPIDNGPVEIEVSPTPDITDNWKTYKNEKYGFEFKYPFLNENLVEEKEPMSDLGEIFARQFGKQTDGSYSFSLVVYLNKNKFDLKTFYKKMSDSRQFYEGLMFDEKFVSGTKRLGDGQKVYYFKDGYCVSLCDRYVWSNGVMVFEFINFHPEISQNNLIFDQILSTFKFLD